MQMAEIWQWAKEHDAPNWFSIAFSLVVWPIVLYWYSQRKRYEIPHLAILFSSSKTVIGEHCFDAVALTFRNLTGSVVFLSRARLREQYKNFSVPPQAVKDLSGWREIKFKEKTSDQLRDLEVVLQTNESAETSIAVSQPLVHEFYSYRRSKMRWLFRKPKFFTLEFTAMVGQKRYVVEAVY
jgi:hypothetical protein